MEPVQPNEAKTDALEIRKETLRELKLAVQYGPATRCAELVAQAGEMRLTTAVPALAQLLKRPRSMAERVRCPRPEWRRVRYEAVEALQKIGSLPAVDALTPALFDRDLRVQLRATDALRSFGWDAVSPLLNVLDRERNWNVGEIKTVIEILDTIGDRRSGPGIARILLGTRPLDANRWTRATLGYPATIVAAIALLLTLLVGVYPGMPVLFIPLAFVIALLVGEIIFAPLYLAVLLPISMVWANRERSQLAQCAADALIRLEDKYALPSVIEAAYGASRKMHTPSRRALEKLLPLLEPQDVGILPPESVRHLIRSLSFVSESFSPQPPSLTVAILYALQKVGPGSAAEVVEKLGERSAVPQIRIAARDVLPTLQERRRQERAATNLLRASSAPPAAPDQLLRPVQTAQETDPNQLLRPGHFE